MFGPDTKLMIDAIQIVVIALGTGAAGTFLWMKFRKQDPSTSAISEIGKTKPQDLEQRVQVLERIATDRSIDLADEIESLRRDTRKQDRTEAAQ